MIFFVRSAFCVEHDNQDEAIEKIHKVMDEFLKVNALQKKHLKSILLTQTKDLSAFNAAYCLRQKEGYENISLFTSQEVECKKTLARTVRLLIIGHKRLMFRKPQPVYKFGAESLRPDIFNADSKED